MTDAEQGRHCAEPHGCRPTRVLVAEDDPVSRRMAVALLGKWGYEVQTVTDGEEAWNSLEARDSPRLAVLDWMLPGAEGIEVCRRVRRRTARPYVYILLLTTVSQKQHLVMALDAGADDYLVKPFDAAELRARLHAGRRILAAQDELIAARETLRFQATHDPLTGLWNHCEVLSILDREHDRAARDEQRLAVFLIDIDHFKQVNDLHGHLAGDAVLCQISARLTACVRSYDAVGRYGGEEFLVVVPGMDQAGAVALAWRITTRVSERPFPTPEADVRATASVGVALSGPGEPFSPMALVRAADLALYRAKQAGRNRVELCTTEELAGARFSATVNATPGSAA